MIWGRPKIFEDWMRRKAEQRDARERWHEWFAWRPVEMTYPYSGTWAWLTAIEQRHWHKTLTTKNGGFFGGPTWDYHSGWNYRLIVEGRAAGE